MSDPTSQPARRVRSGTQSSAELRRIASPTKQTPSGLSAETSRHVSNNTVQSSPDSQHDRSHQRFVLTDPVAFRYLEEDSSTTVLDRRRELSGYECYIVEQWATSRTHPTFVITTYTGDPSHTVVVGVLSVPTDEHAWSQRLRVYFKALNQYHARRRDTPLGIMMITNLSGFPSSLTVIPVPDGDLRKHRSDFFVNENLKRLGCSGRVGLTLSEPSPATVAKFHQLYRTSDKNRLYTSVIELVKLCQAALNLFDVLEIDYADGLICDVTETAINDWWINIGSEVYSVEPHDGILGPTTVAALLGLLMGARNRLHAMNAPVPKDPFDVDGMKRGIAYFQKNQRLNRNRRLDRATILQLHKVTEKAANSEGWNVPRAVKSTVAELSGKGGDTLADIVGRRDRAGIAEIETNDIDRFEQLVFGDRCKWLWYAKPLKRSSTDPAHAAEPEGHLVFKGDEHGGFSWTARKPTLGGAALAKQLDVAEGQHVSSNRDHDEFDKDDPMFKRSMISRATGGLGDRIKDAVRSHHRMFSRDEAPHSPTDDQDANIMVHKRPITQQSHTQPATSPINARAEDRGLREAPAQTPSKSAYYRKPSHTLPAYGDIMTQTPQQSENSPLPGVSFDAASQDDQGKDDPSTAPPSRTNSNMGTARSSISGSVYHGVDLREVLPDEQGPAQEIGTLLRRTQSYSTFISHVLQTRSTDSQPRHLSFSIAEDGTSAREFADHMNDATSRGVGMKLKEQFEHELGIAENLKQLRASIAQLDRVEASWTREQLDGLMELLAQASQDQQYLETLYYSPLHSTHELKDAAAAVLRDEKDMAEEGSKELETLAAKLDYEMGSLKGKVEDAEAGVKDFERAVVGVEERVDELERESREKRSWGSGCIVS